MISKNIWQDWIHGFTNKRMDSLKTEYNTNGEFKCQIIIDQRMQRIFEKLIHKKLKRLLFEMRNWTNGGNSREFF